MEIGASGVEPAAGGGTRRSRIRDRIAARTSRAVAIAGEGSELVQAIVNAITQAFGDIMLNLTVNSMLDGDVIHTNQASRLLKKVSVMV